MRYSSHTKLLNLVEDRYKNGRFVLGLDGLSRSGKSTLAKIISKLLNQNKKKVIIFHIDDHIVESKLRYDTDFEEWYEYYNLQWDVEFLRENLFAKLREEKEVTLPYYKSELDKSDTRTMSIPQECLIIIEGVFLQREQWRNFFDLLVYLDCPREKRYERESLETRRKTDKFKFRYWKAEEYYLDKVNPVSVADIVINT